MFVRHCDHGSALIGSKPASCCVLERTVSVSVPCFVIRLRVLLSTVDPSFRKTRIVRVLFFFLLLLGRAVKARGRKGSWM